MGEIDALAYSVTSLNAAGSAANSIETQQPGGSGALRQAMVIGDATTRASIAKVTTDGGLNIAGTQAAVSTTNWTSATGINSANGISVVGYNTVSIAMSNTSTMTGGVLTFEVSPDGGTTWFPISVARIDSYTVENTYTLNAVANRAWSTSVDGFTNFRVRLSTVITGTGTASIFVIPQTFAIEPIVSVGQGSAANLNATVVPGNATGAAAPATAMPMGIKDLSGNLETLSAAVAPADANSALTIAAVAAWIYNGASFDRSRTVANATNSAGTGIPAAGILAQLDDTSPTAITENQFGNLRMTAERGLHVSIRPSANSGATTFTLISAATTNATNVKASAGTLKQLSIGNNGASACYVKFYNKATAPTVGTDTPVATYYIPAASGREVVFPPEGDNYGTGISFAITAVGTVADTTAVAATQVFINGAFI